MFEKYLTRIHAGCWCVFFVLSVVFIFTHNYPVFDDSFNITDIQRYARQGLTWDSIRQHANPAGVVSYIWTGLIGNMLGNNLTGYRLAIWLTWVLLFSSFLLLQQNLKHIASSIFIFSLVFLLSDFYSLLAAATLLTEGTSLLFALTGFWLLTISLNKDFERKIPDILLFNIASGLLTGLAVVSRIYYVALIPAVYLTIIFCFFRDKNVWQKIFVYGLSFAFCILPVILLYLTWGGLAPPMLKKVYPMFSSEVGINVNRILPPVLYIGLYSIPVLLTGWKREYIRWHHLLFPVLLLAIVNIQGIYVWRMGVDFVRTGFFDTVITLISKQNNPAGLFLSNFFVFAGGLSFSVISEQIYVKLKARPAPPPKTENPALIFSVFLLFFFCLEQIMIQGNISFYERYMLQIYPFLGVILFSFIQLNRRVWVWLLISFCISVFMLYRN